MGARLAQLRHDLVDRVGQLPGVDAVAFADHGLFSGGRSTREIDVPGFIAQADSEREVSLDRVGPGFLHAVGARLIRGRDIEPHDLETKPLALINETTAKRYFGARDPLARRSRSTPSRTAVVGVVRDFESADVRSQSSREVYIVFNNPKTGDEAHAKLSVHVRGDPSRFVEPIRRAAQSVDPALPVSVDPVNELVRGLCRRTCCSCK